MKLAHRYQIQSECFVNSVTVYDMGQNNIGSVTRRAVAGLMLWVLSGESPLPYAGLFAIEYQGEGTQKAAAGTIPVTARWVTEPMTCWLRTFVKQLYHTHKTTVVFRLIQA